MKQKIKKITPLILVVLVVIIVTSVFAAYLKYSNEVVNEFKPADSTIPEVSEKFEENDRKLKENVRFYVGETEYPVYVRAKIVITWQDEDGKNVYYSNPVEYTEDPQPHGDYTIDLNLTDWKFNENDGFYYYVNAGTSTLKVVESGDYTTNLINECVQINEAPADGYTLSVEIIVQTIQAIGTTDAETYEDGTPAWQDAGWDIKSTTGSTGTTEASTVTD